MFWETFEKLCASVGKAPSTVAEEIGLKSTGTVSGWKNGATPRKSVQYKLAEYFGVSVGYLMGYEQKDNTPAASSDRDVDRFMELFTKLTPEQQERELAYLQQLVDAQDK